MLRISETLCHCERPKDARQPNVSSVQGWLLATLAVLARNDTMSATKSSLHCPPPLRMGQGVGHCEGLPEAINEQRIPNKKRAQSYGEATAQRRFEDCDF